mmetsp:Transcript_15920/g.17678  ORF Transcript_15920/g.17678 Transcript_15920/m.17678 type:complete len:115 (+) Transcript_15920:1-345(+)
MSREKRHVMNFVLVELGSPPAFLNGDSGKLTIRKRGTWGASTMESLLSKYFSTYVICQTCSSPDTVLERDTSNRLTYKVCRTCKAKASVITIRTGFQAIGRGERRQQRNEQATT